jgi:hypothetical protein
MYNYKNILGNLQDNCTELLNLVTSLGGISSIYSLQGKIYVDDISSLAFVFSVLYDKTKWWYIKQANSNFYGCPIVSQSWLATQNNSMSGVYQFMKDNNLTFDDMLGKITPFPAMMKGLPIPIPSQPIPDQPVPNQPIPDQPVPEQPACPCNYTEKRTTEHWFITQTCTGPNCYPFKVHVQRQKCVTKNQNKTYNFPCDIIEQALQ